MQSPYKRIIAYDLETGGFDCNINSITELAMVAIDMETLEIIDKMSVMILPRVNISHYHGWESIKIAKAVYKNLAVKDEDSGVRQLRSKDEIITLKNMRPLEEAIELFLDMIDSEYPDWVLDAEAIDYLENHAEWGDIMEVFFNNCYNPQALEATHIPRELFENEGVKYEEAFIQCKGFIDKHTIGNSKPIMAGHNIGTLPRRIVKKSAGKFIEKKPDGFDNPFMEVFFSDHKHNYFVEVNEYFIDTLKEARVIYYESAGYNLGTIANSLGITLKEAHRALPDTIATANVIISMLKRYRGFGSKESTYERRKFKLKF